MNVIVTIINTSCITMSEAVTMPNLMMTTSTVSEESFARDRHLEEPGGGLVWLGHSFCSEMDLWYMRRSKNDLMRGCSVCVAASVVPPWHKIKVIF